MTEMCSPEGCGDLRRVLLGRRDVPEDRVQQILARLRARDEDLDDRRMCLECEHLRFDGFCAAARRGALVGASRYLAPVQDILQRCEGFQLHQDLRPPEPNESDEASAGTLEARAAG